MAINVKNAAQILQDYLNTISAEYQRRGIPNPNTSPGTKYYVDGTAIAQQIAVVYAALQLLGDSLMPDTAQGQALIDYASNYGLALKPASSSNGKIGLTTTINPNTAILIAAGQLLQDNSGQQYQVTTTGAYSDYRGANGITDGYIEVQSVDTGSGTNLALGQTLRWVSIPPFANATVQTVTAFTGGSDEETLESLRTRLQQKLATPPGGGNWSQVAEVAESSSPAVQKAFVYPCCDGPASEGVAVTSAPIFGTDPTQNYAGRDFGGDTTILNTQVIPNVIGSFPEFANFIITNCQNQPISVSMGLDLPNSPSAQIPGNGTGWLDPNPFPIPIISGSTYLTGYCDVTSVNSTGTSLTVNADVTCLPSSLGTGPGATVVNICWLSSNDWIFRTAQAWVSGNAAPYTVTLLPNFAFVDTTGATVQVGDWIFPGALNMSVYVSSLLSQFAGLGPGQKISPSLVSGLFPRANRRPLFSDSWPASLGPSIIKFLENTGDEVLGVQYIWRQDVITPGNTNNPGSPPDPNAGQCPIPSSVLSAPYVLIPHRIGFYPNFPIIL